CPARPGFHHFPSRRCSTGCDLICRWDRNLALLPGSEGRASARPIHLEPRTELVSEIETVLKHEAISQSGTCGSPSLRGRIACNLCYGAEQDIRISNVRATFMEISN